MGFRDVINKRPGVIAAVAVCAVAIFAGIFAWSERGRSVASVKQMFYSDDDGKTWFADDVDKIYPFDHNGKPAYRAYVYRCGERGQPFVGYLARFPDKAKKKLDALHDGGKDADFQAALAELSQAIEVKRPGDADWVSQYNTDITAVKCPDGSLARGVSP